VDIILLVLHVILSLGIITLVLLQKGAGASAGASFGGGGGAGSVFGASGSANFLSKTTAIFAIGFFINSLVLAYLAANREIKTDSVLDELVAPVSAPTVIVPETSDVPPPEGLASPDAVAPDVSTGADNTSAEESVPAEDTPAPADE
jgi:preprotein translocase subunit SecG